MGHLVPEDLPLSRLDRSERRVVQKLMSGLRDSWIIIPRYDLSTPRRPYELDVLLVNDRVGIVGVEVKGGSVEIREGEWYRGNSPLRSPVRQAQDASYALRDRLRERSPLLEHVHVQHAVALPDVAEAEGQFPEGFTRQHLLLTSDLEDPDDRLWDLLVANYQNRALTSEQLEAVVAILRPDVSFRWDPDAATRHARTMLHRVSTEQTRALATLDQNRRVLVTGRAGSGKTRLALAWSERAVARGEQVMLTCFNRPLSEWLAESALDHERLMVGTLQRLLMNLPGIPVLEAPAGAGSDWWQREPFEHAERHLAEVATLFDTIIVDEAQDLAPAWLATLEKLLRPDGPCRLLRVADPAQVVYRRGFEMSEPGPEVVRADLTVNCRNAHHVADLLRSFGGAPSAPGVPEGHPVLLQACDGLDDAVAWVGRFLDELVVQSHVDPANVLVVTGHRVLRDRIREEDPGGWGCAAWEDRHSGEIVCETIHRVKGLERDAVILVTVDDDLEDHLLYVGMSRAVSRLVVIGPTPMLDRLSAKARLRLLEEVGDG
jgi:hypothetical protein